MKNFGFSSIKPRVIDYDRNHRHVLDYIMEREPSFGLCIGCGGCAATCSAAQFTDISLRKLNILVKRGENDEVRRLMNKCMLCGKCTLVCPRGVNTRNVIFLTQQAFRKLDNYAV